MQKIIDWLLSKDAKVFDISTDKGEQLFRSGEFLEISELIESFENEYLGLNDGAYLLSVANHAKGFKAAQRLAFRVQSKNAEKPQSFFNKTKMNQIDIDKLVSDAREQGRKDAHLEQLLVQVTELKNEVKNCIKKVDDLERIQGRMADAIKKLIDEDENNDDIGKAEIKQVVGVLAKKALSKFED